MISNVPVIEVADLNPVWPSSTILDWVNLLENLDAENNEYIHLSCQVEVDASPNPMAYFAGLQSNRHWLEVPINLLGQSIVFVVLVDCFHLDADTFTHPSNHLHTI